MPLFVTDPIYLEHFNGAGHPEQPARMQAIETRLKRFCLWDLLEHIPARDATLEQIQRCHDRAYIDRVRKASASAATDLARITVLDADTSCSPQSYAAARRSAGAVLAACDAVARGDDSTAFCAVRPPGHHARPG